MLRVEGLTTGYRSRGRTYAVSPQLEGELPEGRLTCLVGTNGAGKSTLLRTMAGLLPPLGGRVSVGGRALDALSPAERARAVAVVLTGRPDVAHLRVGELVALGRIPHTGFSGRLSAADRAVVADALRRTGVDGMARRPVTTLSDGECQRAMVARALAQATPVLLLDEPTAFLDFPAKAALFDLLADLAHTEGKAVLVSTHDVGLAARRADLFWLLDGAGLHAGPPAALTDALRAAFGTSDLPF